MTFSWPIEFDLLYMSIEIQIIGYHGYHASTILCSYFSVLTLTNTSVTIADFDFYFLSWKSISFYVLEQLSAGDRLLTSFCQFTISWPSFLPQGIDLHSALFMRWWYCISVKSEDVPAMVCRFEDLDASIKYLAYFWFNLVGKVHKKELDIYPN